MGLNLFGYGQQEVPAVAGAGIQNPGSEGPGVVAKGGTALSYFGLAVNVASQFAKVPESVKMIGKGASIVSGLQKANGVASVLGTGVEAVGSAFALSPQIRLVGKGLSLIGGLGGKPSQESGKDQIGYMSGMLPTAFATGALALETLAPYAPALVGSAVPVVGQIGTGLAILNAGYGFYRSYTKV